jgi:hypothetical protein
VYRWYGQLRAVEQTLEKKQGTGALPEQMDAVRTDLLRRLDAIEAGANHIPIPLAYADALYGLRSHINFVRQRVRAGVRAE